MLWFSAFGLSLLLRSLLLRNLLAIFKYYILCIYICICLLLHSWPYNCISDNDWENYSKYIFYLGIYFDDSILLYGLECLPLTSTLQNKHDSACRCILRYALGDHFPDCISNAELTRRTGATALSKALRRKRLRIVRHALRMANPSPLTILPRFLQPRLRSRCGQARTLTFHQDIIDDFSAINQSVKSITSAIKSYYNRIVATIKKALFLSAIPPRSS